MKQAVLCLFSVVMIILVATQNIKAQTVAYDLPKTWEIQLYNSVMRTTLHEDGRLTSETLFGCYNCQGTGNCQVCHGSGGQYWYRTCIKNNLILILPQ